MRNAPPRKCTGTPGAFPPISGTGLRTKNRPSGWRRGRQAKDGNDTTQQGLVKMLNLSNEGGFEEGFRTLHPPHVPLLRIRPLRPLQTERIAGQKRKAGNTKKENEDYLNIETGITNTKALVHLGIQPELQEEIDRLSAISNVNDKLPALAAMIDRSIYAPTACSTTITPLTTCCMRRISGRSITARRRRKNSYLCG